MLRESVFVGMPDEVAEKLKLSIANPWALPVALAISQTNHRAAPAGQLVITWFITARLIWFVGFVPSTAAPPTSPATVGKDTFKAGKNAVAWVDIGAAADGSMK